MNITVVDGYTLNPGDLSWSEFDKLGRCTVYNRSSRPNVIQRCQDAAIVITNKVTFDRETLLALDKLKFIAVTATGYNVVDVACAKEKGVRVSNVPTYGTRSVAQMVFALLLELTNHVAHHARTASDGQWARCDDFCYWDFPLIELDGLTMGLVGYGRIGQATALLARAFGMKVVAYDVNSASEMNNDVMFVSLDELFAVSDVISLHCPLTRENEGMVNAQKIARMKPTSFLINTSRGPLVNERDLADALNSGKIAGAGLDVLTIEPPVADNPLLHAKNCYVTPHISWATKAARARLLKMTFDNVQSFLKGTPQNLVN